MSLLEWWRWCWPNGQGTFEVFGPKIRVGFIKNLVSIGMVQTNILAPFFSHIGCHIGWVKVWAGSKVLWPNLPNPSDPTGQDLATKDWASYIKKYIFMCQKIFTVISNFVHVGFVISTSHLHFLYGFFLWYKLFGSKRIMQFWRSEIPLHKTYVLCFPFYFSKLYIYISS